VRGAGHACGRRGLAEPDHRRPISPVGRYLVPVGVLAVSRPREIPLKFSTHVADIQEYELHTHSGREYELRTHSRGLNTETSSRKRSWEASLAGCCRSRSGLLDLLSAHRSHVRCRTRTAEPRASLVLVDGRDGGSDSYVCCRAITAPPTSRWLIPIDARLGYDSSQPHRSRFRVGYTSPPAALLIRSVPAHNGTYAHLRRHA
jgi:hypothetical protein